MYKGKKSFKGRWNREKVTWREMNKAEKLIWRAKDKGKIIWRAMDKGKSHPKGD